MRYCHIRKSGISGLSVGWWSMERARGCQRIEATQIELNKYRKGLAFIAVTGKNCVIKNKKSYLPLVLLTIVRMTLELNHSQSYERITPGSRKYVLKVNNSNVFILSTKEGTGKEQILEKYWFYHNKGFKIAQIQQYMYMRDYWNSYNLGMLWFVIEKTVLKSWTFKPWIYVLLSIQNKILKTKYIKIYQVKNKKKILDLRKSNIKSL